MSDKLKFAILLIVVLLVMFGLAILITYLIWP